MSERILALGGDVYGAGSRGQPEYYGPFQAESVVAVRPESEPALVVKRTAPPDALPPDCPGTSVTDSVNWLPAAAFCLSPVLVSNAATVGANARRSGGWSV